MVAAFDRFPFKCYLCGNTSYILRKGHARDNKDLVPLECSRCGLVSLSSFSHINNSFYRDSHMHDNAACDPKLELLQSQEDTERRVSQFKDIFRGKKLLDFGCGAGGFLLKARHIAHSVIGVEPEQRLYPFFKENNLTVYPSIQAVPSIFEPDIVTMFHVLEHLPDPLTILKQIRQQFFKIEKSQRNKRLVIEVPSANDALLTLYKNEPFSQFTYWSCHLYLFTEETLKKLVEKAGFHTIEIIQFQRYPLANHMYWLAHGKPGGHVAWSFLNESGLVKKYADTLGQLKACDTIIGIFS